VVLGGGERLCEVLQLTFSFCSAKFVVDKTYTLCGTPNYLSPEVIMNRGHNASSDHWSLGVLIYEMVAGESPFYYDGMPQMELFQCIVREKFYPLPDDVSDEAFYLVDELLEKDPTLRLGSLAGRGKDIVAKDWFNEYDLDQLRQKKVKAPFIPKNAELEGMLQGSSSSLQNSQGSFILPLPTKDGSYVGAQSSGSVSYGNSSVLNRSSLLDDDDD
jgi:serine/threonine protein kinase